MISKAGYWPIAGFCESQWHNGGNASTRAIDYLLPLLFRLTLPESCLPLIAFVVGEQRFMD